jgi:hypothetical protein
LNSVTRNPDNINYTQQQGYSHYGGWPFDGQLYTDTSFRVVAETWRQNIPWITEKTYITILNRHPFILAAPTGTLTHLQSLGFKTFTEYLPVKHYDSIENIDQRWQAVLENTKFWLSNIHKFEQNIRQDIEHNYQHLMFLSQQIKSQFGNLVKELGDPNFNVYCLIDLHDITDDWMRFYYNIKDPSWPDCYHHNQFNLLPIHIQKECVEVFNYQPRN